MAPWLRGSVAGVSGWSRLLGAGWSQVPSAPVPSPGSRLAAAAGQPGRARTGGDEPRPAAAHADLLRRGAAAGAPAAGGGLLPALPPVPLLPAAGRPLRPRPRGAGRRDPAAPVRLTPPPRPETPRPRQPLSLVPRPPQPSSQLSDLWPGGRHVMGHPRHVASPNSGRLDEGHDAAHTCACAHTRLHPCTGSARRGRRDPGHAPRVCARTHTHVPSRVPCSGTGDPAPHCRERPGEGWDTARAGGGASRRRTLAVTTDGLQATRTPHSPSLSGLRCPGRAVANGSLSFWPPLWCWGRGRPWLGGSSWGAGAGLRADAGPATPGAAEQARA